LKWAAAAARTAAIDVERRGAYATAAPTGAVDAPQEGGGRGRRRRGAGRRRRRRSLQRRRRRRQRQRQVGRPLLRVLFLEEQLLVGRLHIFSIRFLKKTRFEEILVHFLSMNIEY